MTAAEKTKQVVVTKHYDLTAEGIFDAFLDVTTASRFLFATATGEMIRAEIDPRIGGRFTFVDRRPDMGDVLHTGEYLEIDRPHRLVFTFGVPQFNRNMTRVTVEIATAHDGCELTLTNDEIPEDYAERNHVGWSRFLNGLVPAMSGVKAAGWS